MALYSELEYIRFGVLCRSRAPARVAFRYDNAIFGVYWGGETDKWVPAKWGWPNGNFRNDMRQDDRDLNIHKDLWKKLKITETLKDEPEIKTTG